MREVPGAEVGSDPLTTWHTVRERSSERRSRHTELLLVEDSCTDADLAIHAFRHHGYEGGIQVVRDGAEALDFLFCRGSYMGRDADDLPRCVLLDLKLPQLDGHEVLRQIRDNPRTRRVPVVIFTSSGQERDMAASYDLGANSYLVKPLDFGDLQDVAGELARYWLERNQFASPVDAGSRSEHGDC